MWKKGRYARDFGMQGSWIIEIFPFLKMAEPMANESSWARDRIWATAVTYAEAAAMPDP